MPLSNKNKNKSKNLVPSLMVFEFIIFLSFLHCHNYFSILLLLLKRNCHHFKFFPLLAHGILKMLSVQFMCIPEGAYALIKDYRQCLLAFTSSFLNQLLGRVCLVTFTLLCTHVRVVRKLESWWDTCGAPGDSIGYGFEENELNSLSEKKQEE